MWYINWQIVDAQCTSMLHRCKIKEKVRQTINFNRSNTDSGSGTALRTIRNLFARDYALPLSTNVPIGPSLIIPRFIASKRKSLIILADTFRNCCLNSYEPHSPLNPISILTCCSISLNNISSISEKYVATCELAFFTLRLSVCILLFDRICFCNFFSWTNLVIWMCK